MSWEKWQESSEKGPYSILLRVVLLGTVIVGLMMLIAIPLGWFDEASTVAKQEFGPKAALNKYEWFIDQAERINKMEQDIKIFEKRLADVDHAYSAYGDRSKWAPDIRIQYNHERQIASDDLVAMKSQRNSIVQEYNAQSEKFNWQPFLTRDDKPREKFEVYQL